MGELMLESNRPEAGTLAVNSPFDGRVLDQVATCGADHVDDALAAAHSLFRNRDSWLSVPERLEILNKAAAIMQTQVEELTLLAITTNYRIGRVEASLLRLLTTEDCLAVMNTITDLDSFNELVKKNLSQLESSGTDNGPPVELESTPQLSLTG